MRYSSIKTPPPPSATFLRRVFLLQQFALSNPEKLHLENLKTISKIR
jgi:hypothetical protein